jgi:hypothetical protein
MTLVSAALVAVAVLAIGAIRSISWRAFVYSMPVPITLVIVTTGPRADGGQLLGVLLLNVFVTVVTLLHSRAGWHIILADAGGVATYLGLAWLIAELPPIPFLPILAAVCPLWILAMVILPPGGDATAVPAGTAPPRERLAKAAAVVGSSLLMVAAGNLINGLAVTFPYAGVLVVIETRQHLGEFARHFAKNSVALIAFFTGYWALQDRNSLLAIVGAWLAFAAAAAALRLFGKSRGGR